MLRRSSLMLACACAALLPSSITAKPQSGATASADPYANETRAQRDVRMRWWREARFGMFIHWGVYSVPAGTYHGRQIDGIGEWIMNTGKIPCAEYQSFAKQFNPVKFDADAWVRAAKAAGMKYIVITSKHHDGFAMFHSKASRWNIYDASPFHRDPLKELSAACRKNGIRLGFYYSQAQDWNNTGGAAAGGHWDKAQDGSMDDYIRNVAVPQVREILSNYGHISVLWWDTPVDMTPERAAPLIQQLKLQPGIIHNNRLGGGFSGDTETPEQFVPATGYGDRDWETCMTMNDTWGFKSYDHNWKSTETLVRNLIDIASKGGNYLLNVGPTSEGEIPAPSRERLKEVGDWMKVNGPAIYATMASPFKKLPWGRCTKKVTRDGATLFLHVFDWPTNGTLLVPGLKNAVASAHLIQGEVPLKTAATNEGVIIRVPDNAPNAISSTIVLRVRGALNIEQSVLHQAADGTVTLSALDAICHGSVKYESGDERNCIGFWTSAQDWIEWQFQADKPGRYTVTADVASPAASAFTVEVAGKSLRCETPRTGDYGTFQKVEVGTVEIGAAGRITVKVTPVADGWQAVNLRSVHLAPAA